jgi:hypothetical protein
MCFSLVLSFFAQAKETNKTFAQAGKRRLSIFEEKYLE